MLSKARLGWTRRPDSCVRTRFQLSVASAEEAIAELRYLIAERLSQDIEIRAALKDW